MQRDRHQEIEAPAIEPRVVQRFCQPVGDRETEMNLLTVFKVVDDFAHDPAAAVSGDTGFEMEDAVRAVRTGKYLGDVTVKWFRASGTERRLDPGRFRRAG